MSKKGTKRLKANTSVFFKNNKGEEHFLIQVLNFGKDRDELKFIFNDPDSQTRATYTEKEGVLDDTALMRARPEITYHNDGSLLHKLVADDQDPRTIYKNPGGQGSRRKPLDAIGFWEPFLQYKIVDYKLCRKKSASNVTFLPKNDLVFDGTPFMALFYLGSKDNPTPIPRDIEVSFRLADIAESVDLLVIVTKSRYYGQPIKIGQSDTVVWSSNNVLEVIERVGWKGSVQLSPEKRARIEALIDEINGHYLSLRRSGAWQQHTVRRDFGPVVHEQTLITQGRTEELGRKVERVLADYTDAELAEYDILRVGDGLYEFNLPIQYRQ